MLALLLSLLLSAPVFAADHFLLNCGASINQRFGDRLWETDTAHKQFLPPNAADISLTSTAAAEQGPSVPQVPYTTGVRFFTSQFTYSFPVSAGPKFLRLHFYPAQYIDGGGRFVKTESFFSVTAGSYTLLSNFSAYLTVSGVDPPVVFREFLVNVDETLKKLDITFTPSPKSYAFVNGIEIVSIPAGFYIRGEDDTGEHPITWVGSSGTPYYISDNTALETLYRFNVGGKTVSPYEDSGMFRTWYSDDDYVVGYGYQTPSLDVNVSYTPSAPAYSAPASVYTTSRTISNHSNAVNWTFPVDSGFIYLFRLYLCEFMQEITMANQRVFTVDIENTTAEAHMDVFMMAGGSRIPIFKDYAVQVPETDGLRRGKRDVWFAIRPNMESQSVWANAILNGLEIFKLNDTTGSFAVPNPEPPVVASVNQSPPPPQARSNKKVKRKAWSVSGGVATIMLLVLLGFLIFQHRRRRVRDSPSDMASHATKTSWAPLSPMSASTQTSGFSATSSLPSDLCRHFSLEDLKFATDNFDESLVIGRGGFGKVYRGLIDNGATPVAIKRLNPESSQGVREFRTEIEMLSKLRHVHLVPLIGYCNDGGEMIIVYDYMSRGTLRDHIYKSPNPPLPWKRRLEICIGAAKGLHYLHTGAKYSIIHRDVKSTNILLDDRWVAKVSDFGLSKVGPLGGAETHVSTAVKGSIGYVDPEYYRRQQVTEKSDVYSFGVVLFEVLCARPAVVASPIKERVSLAEWARQCYRRGSVEEMVDPRLTGEIAAECLNTFAEIACNCLKDQGIERPAMSDVVWSLEFALQLQEAAEKSMGYGGAGVDGVSLPNSPSYPLLEKGESSITVGTTADDDGGFLSTSEEAAAMFTGSRTVTSTASSSRFQSDNVFSVITDQMGQKLTDSNYPAWSLNVKTALEANLLLGWIDGHEAAPPKILSKDGKENPNPEFQTWIVIDTQIRACLLVVISPSVHKHVRNFTTSADLWNALAARYNSVSTTHIYQLRDKLHTLRKGTKTITQYLDEVATILTDLDALNEVIPERDVVNAVIRGLPHEYSSFKQNIRMNNENISLNQLSGWLTSEEKNL
ncbi:unnamed protein product [Cuscuta campestris]|uniref:Protein kinase domain-containing protein n=1 Tax=Cuscuta campestris TaxID=132261 RepID=A0A484NSB0_9ASTE|nr:unnamed protein product [Cuscuta campestris]